MRTLCKTNLTKLQLVNGSTCHTLSLVCGEFLPCKNLIFLNTTVVAQQLAYTLWID